MCCSAGMDEPVRQRVLKRLAVMALALANGSPPDPQELSQIPEGVVDALLERSELEAMDDDDRGRLYRVLARHPGARVRENLASRILEKPAPLTSDVVDALSALTRDEH